VTADEGSQLANGDDADRLEDCRMRLIAAAIRAYEQAGLSGLCHEGRWECALAALRRTPLTGDAEAD
jgi:hypothetical protein